MYKVVVAIKKLWPPYSPGDKRTNLEDSDGNKYRVEVITAAGFHDGDVVELDVSDEKTPEKYGGKEFKLIHKIKHADGADTAHWRAAPPPQPTDIGPHAGMWEKEAFVALRSGMTSAQVIVMGIEARQAAREILRTNLDGKLPQVKSKADFDDDPENNY